MNVLGAGANTEKTKDTEKKATSNTSLPPHLRAAAKANGTTSLPPHLRMKAPSNALVTDNHTDTIPILTRPAPEPSPPASPTTSFAPDVPRQSVEEPYAIHSGKGWMPLAIANLPMLGPEEVSNIPTAKDTITFSSDFLSNLFGGSFWSPGLKCTCYHIYCPIQGMLKSHRCPTKPWRLSFADTQLLPLGRQSRALSSPRARSARCEAHCLLQLQSGRDVR